jgi:predicted dehydrogenase
MLNAVIIGCGNIAGGYDLHSKKGDFYTHIKAYQANKHVQVKAVFDINAEVAENFISTWGVQKAYTDLSLMLAECKPDMVSICSPNQYHCEQVRACVDAGVKTILCEKPLSYNVDQAVEVIEYCREKKVSLVINYLRNWDEAFLRLESELKASANGELEAVHVNYNKGVFHNASHFINLFVRSLGSYQSAKIIRKEPKGDDAFADFLLSFASCDKVYFFNHSKADVLITELEFFFKDKRIKIEKGGLVFTTEDYNSGEKTTRKGSINRCMKNVIDDVVMGTLKRTGPDPWKSNLDDTITTTKICEQIVKL